MEQFNFQVDKSTASLVKAVTIVPVKAMFFAISAIFRIGEWYFRWMVPWLPIFLQNCLQLFRTQPFVKQECKVSLGKLGQRALHKTLETIWRYVHEYIGKEEICYPHHITTCEEHFTTHSTNGRDFHGGSRTPIHCRPHRRPNLFRA